jgi:hypothetical protein
MNRAIFAQAAKDAFAVLGAAVFVTPKETGTPVQYRAMITVPNPGDHEGLAPKSIDSVWIDLPKDAAARTGDLVTSIDELDGQLRAWILTGWPERSSLDLWTRWIGVRLALPEGMTAAPHAYPTLHWNGTDWVPRPG